MTRTNEVMTSANLTWLQVLHFRFESARYKPMAVERLSFRCSKALQVGAPAARRPGPGSYQQPSKMRHDIALGLAGNTQSS